MLRDDAGCHRAPCRCAGAVPWAKSPPNLRDGAKRQRRGQGKLWGTPGGWQWVTQPIRGWRQAGHLPRQPGVWDFCKLAGPVEQKWCWGTPTHPALFKKNYYYFCSFPGWVSPCLRRRGQSCLIQLPSQGLLLAQLYALLFARVCALLQGR